MASPTPPITSSPSSPPTIPKTMKAITIPSYGPPSICHLSEAHPVPQPSAPTDILLKTHATTINRTDCGMRAGHPLISRLFFGLFSPSSTILGCEFAGEVVQIGPSPTASPPKPAEGVKATESQPWKVGDRLFGYNDDTFGGHAQYLLVRNPDTAAVAKIPEGIPYTTAAAAAEGSHYALTMMRRSSVGPGTRILVNGATGAIGSAAVQLCVAAGADVTAVCAGPHMNMVKGLGAKRVIDYTAEDFTSVALESEEDKKFEVIIDAVGKSTLGRCKPLLTKKGYYISSELGPWSQNILFALCSGTWVTGGKKVVFPIPMLDQDMIEYFAGLMEKGEFKPVIDREVGMGDVVGAYEYVHQGEKIGNVVMVTGHEDK